MPARDTSSRRTESPRTDVSAAGPAPRVVHVVGDLDLDRICTAREAGLVQRIGRFFEALPASSPPGTTARLSFHQGLQSLATLALALESYPSLKDRSVLGGKERSPESLRRTLLEGGEHGLEWALPTKAVVARTYGIAKVNFLTAMAYGIQACEGPEAAVLLADVRDAIEEAVYIRLAEELFGGFITSRLTTPRVKDLASVNLVDLWEGRTHVATDRFCPLLRSAWAARTRAPRVFGTLMGTQEILTLLFQDCDAKFVSWFGQYQEESEQRQAFEEFLFDLPFENLERVRQRMREEAKTCVGPREVERYLGLAEGAIRPLVGDPKDLYVSFRRRRVKAQYRSAMGAPGPKRTAEGYLLEALLLEEASRADDGCGTKAPEARTKDGRGTEARSAEKRAGEPRVGEF